MVPDLYEPFGKLKVDYDVDDLNLKLQELKSRFKASLCISEWVHLHLNSAPISDVVSAHNTPDFRRK